MMANFSRGLRRPVIRLALVGTIVMLLASFNAPLALGASPTPTPKASPSASPSSSKTKPSPTPKPKEQPPTIKVPVGKAPTTPSSLQSRTNQATRQFAQTALPVTNCQRTTSGTTPTCSFDLWARTGSVSPGAAPGLTSAMPIWGFTLDSEEQGRVPGPILIVKQSQQISVTLHNVLPAAAGNLSLEIPAANVTPDLAGIARNAKKTYTFAGLQPGTYIYQAGPTDDAPRQIMMGLSGILIVRPNGYSPTSTSAYASQASQFQAEATLQINEFDSGFNRNPFTFDLNTYEPDVFLLNGRAFSSGGGNGGGDNGGNGGGDNGGNGGGDNGGGNGEDPSTIEVLAGSTLLLHYANHGNHDRGFTVLNHRQRILMDDSSGNFANPVATVPAQFAQHPADVATKWLTPGQVADSFITLDPQYSEGTRIPVYESGFHLWKADGTAGLGGMMTYLLVHGLNGTATGPVTKVAVNAATVAGSTPATQFTGTQSLTFSGSMTSQGPVLQAEWFLDQLAAPNSGRPFTAAQCDGGFTLNLSARTFSCTITASTLNTLLLALTPTDGDHVIWVHGRSAAGWGAVTGDVFTYNVTGPDTGALTAHLTPTNGSRINDIANGAGPGGAYLPSTDLVVLGTSAQSLADWTVLKAEYCLDQTTCTNGSGIPMFLTPPMTAALTTTLTSGLTLGQTYSSISVQSAPVAIVDGSTLVIGSGANTLTVTTVGNKPATAGPTTINVASFTANANYNAGTVVAGTVLAGPDPTGTACAPTVVDYGTPGNPNSLPAAPGGGSVVAWCGFVSTATLTGLPEGSHILYAHAYEAPPGSTTAGRWGDYKIDGASIKFVIDRHGPVTSNIAIDPSPNNGNSSQSGNLNFLDSLQVAAQLTDVPTPSASTASNIASAEVFVTDTTKNPVDNPALFTTGTGAEMIPANAKWGDAPAKQAYAYIPLSVLTAYKDGMVRFWVHAVDTAGNWGDFASVDMILDRTSPILTAVAPTPMGAQLGTCGAYSSATPSTNPCTIHFSATDPGTAPAVATNIISGEWFLGQNIVRLPGDDVATSNDPGKGLAIPFSITPPATTVTDRTFQVTPALIAQYLISINATTATLPPGTTLYIVFRVRDAAGNWSNNQYVVGTA
jgi:hypothetical protein